MQTLGGRLTAHLDPVGRERSSPAATLASIRHGAAQALYGTTITDPSAQRMLQSKLDYLTRDLELPT